MAGEDLLVSLGLTVPLCAGPPSPEPPQAQAEAVELGGPGLPDARVPTACGLQSQGAPADSGPGPARACQTAEDGNQRAPRRRPGAAQAARGPWG